VTCNFLPTNPPAEAIPDPDSTQSGSQNKTDHDFASRDVEPADLITSSHVKRPLGLDSGKLYKDFHRNLTRGHGIAFCAESCLLDTAMVPKSACALSDSAPFRDDVTAARHSISPDYLSNSEDDGQILDSVLSDDKEKTNHVNIETRDEEYLHPSKRCRVGCSPNLTSPCQEGTALPISEQPGSTLVRQSSAFSGEIYHAITPCQAAGHNTPFYPEEIIPIDPAILNDRTAAND
jgi:hypothetical protein